MRRDDPRVEMMLRQAKARRESFEVQGRELDLQDIPFPSVLHYGFEHANNVMLMAQSVAASMGITKKETLDAIKLAGLFHDVGRLAAWQQQDAEHRFRSVEAWRVWGNSHAVETSIMDEVAFLIANHTLAGKPPIDHRLISLWDADCLEAARFAPNTGDGLRAINQKAAMLISPFAKNVMSIKAHRDAWLRYRGWKK